MIRIRKFELSDLPEVMEIEKVSFPNREAWSEDYFKSLTSKYPAGFLVAEENGKIVGYTIGRLKNRVPTKWVGEILSLAVNPPWRKKGIGTNLTNFLLQHFKEKGVKKIFLHVRTKNKEAISFYQNSGFKILKTIKNYYRNGDNAYLMKMDLGE